MIVIGYTDLQDEQGARQLLADVWKLDRPDVLVADVVDALRRRDEALLFFLGLSAEFCEDTVELHDEVMRVPAARHPYRVRARLRDRRVDLADRLASAGTRRAADRARRRA